MLSFYLTLSLTTGAFATGWRQQGDPNRKCEGQPAQLTMDVTRDECAEQATQADHRYFSWRDGSVTGRTACFTSESHEACDDPIEGTTNGWYLFKWFEPLDDSGVWQQQDDPFRKCPGQPDQLTMDVTREQCAEQAEQEGHPYFSWRDGSVSGRTACFTSDACKDPIVGTTNGWYLYKYVVPLGSGTFVQDGAPMRKCPEQPSRLKSGVTRDECAALATEAGHPFFSWRDGSVAGSTACFTSHSCDSPIEGTTNAWHLFKWVPAPATSNNGVEYYQGPAGGECPSSDVITDRATCRSAHQFLGLETGPEWSGSHGGIPVGCGTRQDSSGFVGHEADSTHLHWNTASTGQGRQDITPVCIRRFTGPVSADFYQLDYGTECPVSDRITDMGTCRTAHRRLGLELTPEWTGAYNRIPVGCTTRQDSSGFYGHRGVEHSRHLHLNSLAYGQPRRDLAPICLRWVHSGNCNNDVTAPACRTFERTADFNVVSAPGSTTIFDILATLDYNKALQTVTDAPWNKLVGSLVAVEFGQSLNGCVYYQNQVTLQEARVPLGNFQCPPSSTPTNPCNQNGQGTIQSVNRVSLQHMVSLLNTQGAFELYFQRVQENPIPGADLRWIAENACKVSVPVSFECTGSACVEVQNIVCASFAGIDATNFGVVSIECKVPPSFKIRSAVGGAADDLFAMVNAQGHFSTVQNGLTDGAPQAGTQACGNNKCQIVLKSDQAIPQSATISGEIKVFAEIRSIQMSGQPWSNSLDLFHAARYDLSRKSAPAQTLSMPIGVNFYTDSSAQELNTLAAIAGKFSPAVDSVPFLATQSVQLGQIQKNVHGYLRLVAKVAAGQHWFRSRSVTAVELDIGDGNGFNPLPAGNPCAPSVPQQLSFAVGMNVAVGTTHTANNYPVSFMSCPAIMNTINAGDVMRFSLAWTLANTVQNAAEAAGTNGKAQLLQEAAEADPNAQSVEVQVTIQMGAPRTNVTVSGAAGGAGASATTYIIIAVCVISAALVLGVVVVVFVCMRTKTQQEAVFMSPHKATVSAVYDINMPKKARKAKPYEMPQAMPQEDMPQDDNMDV